jgi:hypothetical protein
MTASVESVLISTTVEITPAKRTDLRRRSPGAYVDFEVSRQAVPATPRLPFFRPCGLVPQPKTCCPWLITTWPLLAVFGTSEQMLGKDECRSWHLDRGLSLDGFGWRRPTRIASGEKEADLTSQAPGPSVNPNPAPFS